MHDYTDVVNVYIVDAYVGHTIYERNRTTLIPRMGDFMELNKKNYVVIKVLWEYYNLMVPSVRVEAMPVTS